MFAFLTERNVQISPCIAEFFCKSEVDNIDEMCSFAGAHNEVGRFEVAVNQVMGMYKFDS